MGVVFFVELLVPLCVLAPRRIRLFAGLAITLLQLLIFLTGNYAFFNPLTIALCFISFWTMPRSITSCQSDSWLVFVRRSIATAVERSGSPLLVDSWQLFILFINRI